MAIRARNTDQATTHPHEAPPYAATQLRFAYEHENNPNPDILLNSIRKAGYTLESAIGDLADNPLDHDANVVVVSIRKADRGWDLRVADDGAGMDRATLDQMLRLGSRSPHDPSRDLGYYGVGSTTASLSIGRHLHVITCSAGGKLLSGATDLDAVIQAGKFVKHLGDATAEETQLFVQTFAEAGLDVPRTGTVVRVTQCDLFPYRDERKAVKEVREYVAETYRYFIEAGKRFVVNGEDVLAYDPLERNRSDTRILFDDVISYAFPKDHPRHGETEEIGVVLVELPLHGGENEEALHGVSMVNQGLYVMRNHRQIVRAETLGLFTRHNRFNRFRGELLFPGTMDDDLGVSFLKSAYRIALSQSLKDKISEVVRPYLRQVEKDFRPATSADDDVNHRDAEELIRRRAALLRKPKSTRGTRDNANHQQDGAIQPKGTDRSQSPSEARLQSGLADRAKFVAEPLGPYAPYYDWATDGPVMVIKYNADHPFYARMLIAQRDNPSIVNAVDYLTYSLATAEANTWSDDSYKFIAKMREDVSFNLRQLLSL